MSDSSKVFWVPGDDPDMEQAAQMARHTFRYFYRELSWENRRIVPGLELAAVKIAFEDPPEMRSHADDELEREYMWVMEIEFDGKLIHGTLQNDPHSLKSFKAGDRVRVPGKQMFDWMYVQLGEVCGGFTIDKMRSRMGKSERKSHDKAWGLDFGPPGFVKLVPAGYLGEETPKKKGLFSFLGSETSQQQDYKRVAELEHPMSINMRSSLEETLKSHPEFLEQTNNLGMNMLHQLALAGSYDGVDVCLNCGFDPKSVTPNGMTPYTLAKSLGWQRVMTRIQQAGGA
jgi:uncharacterized protein YegJ (DUF2314 family)